MWAGVRAAGRGFWHFWRRGYLYVWANLFWAALTLLVVAAPAAWAGLVRMSYVAHRDALVSLDDFWQGVRESWRKTFVLALINTLLIVTTLSNLIAYANEPGLGFVILRIVWIVSVVAWFGFQLFVWVFYFAMEQPTLIGAFRNAGVMIVTNPLFTLGVLLIITVIGAMSSVLPAAWFLLTGGIFAAIANSAVQDRLRTAGIDTTPLPDESLIADPSIDDV
ncbi:MAG: hypothetical protein SF123_13870 [Chloroflexota bacterium]|nr:hypothetical protein [Chloroflexota bacterium]